MALLMISVDSKQIAYVSYSEDNLTLDVHYYSGKVKKYLEISKAAFDSLAHSQNKYDAFVEITSGEVRRTELLTR
jgi:hypothetical protein